MNHPVPTQKLAGLYRLDESKKELFGFLAKMTDDTSTEKQIFITHHKDVLCGQPGDVTGLAPCSHDKADTGILLHVADAVSQGSNKMLITEWTQVW